MIYAPIKKSCWKVSTDKDVDYGKFWHSIFMILLVRHPRMKWTVPQYGRTEGTVSLKITQLMLHKFTVDENVDHRKITVNTSCRLIHVTVL